MNHKINRSSNIDEFNRNEIGTGGLGDRLRNVDVRQSVDQVRGYAQRNPGKILGGLAALAIGAGLMRRRGNIR
jgi:hypothetical protein